MPVVGLGGGTDFQDVPPMAFDADLIFFFASEKNFAICNTMTDRRWLVKDGGGVAKLGCTASCVMARRNVVTADILPPLMVRAAVSSAGYRQRKLDFRNQ